MSSRDAATCPECGRAGMQFPAGKDTLAFGCTAGHRWAWCLMRGRAANSKIRNPGTLVERIQSERSAKAAQAIANKIRFNWFEYEDHPALSQEPIRLLTRAIKEAKADVAGAAWDGSKGVAVAKMIKVASKVLREAKSTFEPKRAV